MIKGFLASLLPNALQMDILARLRKIVPRLQFHRSQNMYCVHCKACPISFLVAEMQNVHFIQRQPMIETKLFFLCLCSFVPRAFFPIRLPATLKCKRNELAVDFLRWPSRSIRNQMISIATVHFHFNSDRINCGKRESDGLHQIESWLEAVCCGVCESSAFSQFGRMLFGWVPVQ